MREIILASSSPRRSELLRQIGVPFQVLRLNSSEVITETEPEKIVLQLSAQKARAAASVLGGNETRIILGADTIVWAGGRMLGKPDGTEGARKMIRMLQGKTHEVYTGVTLLCMNSGAQPAADSFFARTAVHVHAMTDEEIEGYLETGDSLDKAGAYGIQGPFGAYIDGIEGDYFNVVGLPISMVWQHLKKIQDMR